MFRLVVPEEGFSVVHDGTVVVAIGGCDVAASKDVESFPELCRAKVGITNLSIDTIKLTI